MSAPAINQLYLWKQKSGDQHQPASFCHVFSIYDPQSALKVLPKQWLLNSYPDERGERRGERTEEWAELLFQQKMLADKDLA